MSFGFLPAEISGLYLGKFPQTPLHLLPTPTPYTPPTPYSSSDVGDVGGEASPSRLLSPASSPPVRSPRQRCALLPKQKTFGRAADSAG